MWRGCGQQPWWLAGAGGCSAAGATSATGLAAQQAPTARASHHAHLVQAVAVPRLSDHLGVPQDGVLSDGLDQWGVAQRGAGRHARAVRHHAAVVHDGPAGLKGGLLAVRAHLTGVPGGGGAGEDGRQVKPAGVMVWG